jgi:hypothetical protein
MQLQVIFDLASSSATVLVRPASHPVCTENLIPVDDVMELRISNGTVVGRSGAAISSANTI